MDELERENSLVLQALQASHGLISRDMEAVSIQVDAERVILHFAVRQETSEVEEDVEDMLFELDALLGGATELEAKVYVGVPDSRWPGRRWRLVYLAKPANK